MTTGTEGSDTLTNDTTIANEVVNTLGGDDRIILTMRFVPSIVPSTIVVDGGDGFDTLVLNTSAFSNVWLQNAFGSGLSGGVTARNVSAQRTSTSWTSIERLELSGAIILEGHWSFGDSQDILTFRCDLVDRLNSVRLSTAGGDDEIRLSGLAEEVDLHAGDGNDLIDLSALDSYTGTSRWFAFGGAGDDQLVGSIRGDNLFGGDGDDVLDGGGNADTIYGGRGNDLYLVDQIEDDVGEFADEGVDEIRTALSSYGRLQDFIQVENLTLLGTGANVAAGNDLANRITANAGDDTLYARGGNDVLMLHFGGADIAFGEAGKDVFYFGDAYTPADLVNGGTEVDLLVLQGDYSGANALSLGALPDIEQVFLLSAADNRYGLASSASFSYRITTTQETVAPNQLLYVNALSVRVGESVSFDGSAETDGGRFYLYGSRGIDRFTGGSGEDVFLFSGISVLEAADIVDGRAGYDHVLLRGSFAPVTFTATTITNIERVALLSGNDPNMGEVIGNLTYYFTLNDANVAAGAELLVDAGNLQAGEWALVNGSGEWDGRLRLVGGAGNDILIGGAGNDVYEGGGGGDTLQDGVGNAIYIYRSTADSLPNLHDRVNGFDHEDRFDFSMIDANAATAQNEAFTFIGLDAFRGQAGELRSEFLESGLRRIEADVNGDAVADFAIEVSVGDGFVFQATDFIL